MGREAQYVQISQKERGTWNFQWQPFLSEFAQDPEGPETFLSHVCFWFQPQLWGTVLWMLRVTWWYHTWSTEVQSSFVCSALGSFLSCQSLVGPGKPPWKCQGVDDVSESSSTNRGLESVDEGPALVLQVGSSGRHSSYLWSSQEMEPLWPIAGTPIMHPYLVFSSLCILLPLVPHFLQSSEITSKINYLHPLRLRLSFWGEPK